MQATSFGSDQTACMCRLVWAIADRIYHIVGNLIVWLIYSVEQNLFSSFSGILNLDYE